MLPPGPLLRRILERAPWSAWSRDSLLFLAAGVPLGLPGAVALTGLVTAESALLVTVPVVLLLGGGWLGAVQRDRFRSLLGAEIPVPPRASGGLWARLRSEAVWRRVAYHLLVAPALGLAGIVVIAAAGAAVGAALSYGWAWALPVAARPPGWTTLYGYVTAAGLAAVLVLPWIAAGAARLDEVAARALLGPNRAKELARRVETLTESRAGVVDAADAERRRIERDLHDGTQQRLVSLAVNLGLALATMPDLPPEARRVIEEAHRGAKEAIEELSLLVRGLHPAVLEDRGLDAALSGIAERSAVPVELTVDLPPGRAAPPTVEAVAYFVVSEALANIAKHARAKQVQVTAEKDGDMLRIAVRDDGVGGADPAAGTGLRGLARRVASVDGEFAVHSPAGGPTEVTAGLPCAR